jgi:hypothetical protein
MCETQGKALSHARQLSEIDSGLKVKEIELSAQGDDPPPSSSTRGEGGLKSFERGNYPPLPSGVGE